MPRPLTPKKPLAKKRIIARGIRISPLENSAVENGFDMGAGRNQVAREFGVSTGVVSKMFPVGKLRLCERMESHCPGVRLDGTFKGRS